MNFGSSYWVGSISAALSSPVAGSFPEAWLVIEPSYRDVWEIGIPHYGGSRFLEPLHLPEKVFSLRFTLLLFRHLYLSLSRTTFSFSLEGWCMSIIHKETKPWIKVARSGWFGCKFELEQSGYNAVVINKQSLLLLQVITSKFKYMQVGANVCFFIRKKNAFKIYTLNFVQGKQNI